MPELCRFDGIRIYMNFGDHAPPHFHAEYAGVNVEIDIGSILMTNGKLPPRQYSRIRDWAIERHQDLIEAFERASRGEHPGKIEPLR